MQICQLSCESLTMAPILHRFHFQHWEISVESSTTFSIAPRIKRRKGKRRNARNFFPSAFSSKFLEELSVPNAFDLASSVNDFSAYFSLYIYIARLHISSCELSLPSRVFFNNGSFSRSTNLEVVEDVPISLTLPSLHSIARPHPVVFDFPSYVSWFLFFIASRIWDRWDSSKFKTSQVFSFKNETIC